jgi:hypothetical protein
MFALYACLAILTSCATALAFVLPIALHPLIVPCVPEVIGTLMGRRSGTFTLENERGFMRCAPVKFCAQLIFKSWLKNTRH